MSLGFGWGGKALIAVRFEELNKQPSQSVLCNSSCSSRSSTLVVFLNYNGMLESERWRGKLSFVLAFSFLSFDLQPDFRQSSIWILECLLVLQSPVFVSCLPQSYSLKQCFVTNPLWGSVLAKLWALSENNYSKRMSQNWPKNNSRKRFASQLSSSGIGRHCFWRTERDRDIHFETTNKTSLHV